MIKALTLQQLSDALFRLRISRRLFACIATTVTFGICLLFNASTTPSVMYQKSINDISCSCQCSPRFYAYLDRKSTTPTYRQLQATQPLLANRSLSQLTSKSATIIKKRLFFSSSGTTQGLTSSEPIAATTGHGITLQHCYANHMRLKGALNLSTLPGDAETWLTAEDVRQKFPEVGVGGHWKPQKCRSRQKVAIVVPFRDRHAHLARLLLWLTPILQSQMVEFFYVVAEQYGNDLFNKGRIMNAAFLFAVEQHTADCVIFHDVDMLPIDDRILYRCSRNPVHIGAYVDTLQHRLLYDHLVGGVLAISADQFRAVNGYSTMYWGWGGEDDDMGMRIKHNNYSIERMDSSWCRFTMIKHQSRQRVSDDYVMGLLSGATSRIFFDGLSQHKTQHIPPWRTLAVIARPMYFHLLVDVGTVPIDILATLKAT